jgi:5-methyltetrahydropteroyltriglutamate--homocysteine methyltransferase
VAHFFTGDIVLDRSIYPTAKALMDDLARIMREEIADLAKRGCTYLQMDEVPLAVICDRDNQEVVRKRGDDPDELIDLYIDAINDSIRDRPAGMTVCVHMCRGNAGHGMADGGYEPIAERMFNRLAVDGFFLEYDTPRAGDFSPLRHLPKPKKAVLGLMTTKDASLEPVDALKQRIEDATKFVDLDRLCISPQCGFASVPVRISQALSMSDVERKLARVVEVAAEVWG